MASSSNAGVIVRYTAVVTGLTWPRNVDSCRRRGLAVPSGIESPSCDTRWWNVRLTVPGLTARPPRREKRGVDGGAVSDGRARRARRGQHTTDPRPKGHQAAFVELGLPDDEEIARQIDVADAQSRHFSDPQAEPIE